MKTFYGLYAWVLIVGLVSADDAAEPHFRGRADRAEKLGPNTKNTKIHPREKRAAISREDVCSGASGSRNHYFGKAIQERLNSQHLRLPEAIAGSATASVSTNVEAKQFPNCAIHYKYPLQSRELFLKKNMYLINQGSNFIETPTALLAYLSSVQECFGISGSVGEIGVHAGLFFVGIAHLARPGEDLWACDVFEDQAKNIDGSGFGSTVKFQDACAKGGIPYTDIHVDAKSSLELKFDFIQEKGIKPFRLVSVDGGHTRELTYNDLSVMACNLAEGGIIVLDDVTNLAWPGVIDGMFSWLAHFPIEFAPFFVGCNKVFLASREWHATYYEALAAHPFWAKKFMSSPVTNQNIHKSKESGQNEFRWAGYPYRYLSECVDAEEVRRIWLHEHQRSDTSIPPP